ncbi:hypothetical protein [Marinobacterium iners]|uniref:hypothetical protein n=1 Tax=Marinobacterium iners TaxID=48076 RepID=UPI001114C7FE|nr:hypothetical protein [Marinobacterium iners]
MEKYKVFIISEPHILDDDIYCQDLVDNGSCLALTLNAVHRSISIKITFDFFYIYSKSNESYRLETIDKIPDDRYLILTVENSRLAEWFHKESKGIYSDDDVVHYLIITSDEVIDVLSSIPPSIEWSEKGKKIL